MLLSLPVELGYCRARAEAAAAWLWWLPVGGGGGLGTVDLVAVVEAHGRSQLRMIGQHGRLG